MAEKYFTDDNPAKKSYLVLSDKNNNRLSLRVKRKISTSRNFKINDQEMYANKKSNHTTNFYNNGSDGLTFKVTILFLKSEVNQLKQLDAWYREMRPFKIAFDVDLSLNLPLVSKNWIVKDISITQEDKAYTSWDVSFRTYNPPKQIKAVENELLSRTSKSYQWQHKCKKQYWKLNYKKQSQKKWPKSDCVKLLNSIFIELGYMKKQKKKVKTGKKDKKGNQKKKTVKYVPNIWVHGKKKRGRSTSAALKLFKKEWNKYKLKPKLKSRKKGVYSDKIDKDTYTALGKYKKLKSAKKKK